MPQNKKRPVTYGKSPLNRIEPYLRTPSTNERGVKAPYPPISSTQLHQPPHPRKSPSPSPPVSDVAGYSAMQRKKRRLGQEEIHLRKEHGNRGYSHVATTSAHGNHEKPNTLDVGVSTNQPSGRARNRGSHDVADDSIKAESASVAGFKLRRQQDLLLQTEPVLRSRGESPQNAPVAPPKHLEPASTRKRLIDLLGATIHSQVPISMPDDEFKRDRFSMCIPSGPIEAGHRNSGEFEGPEAQGTGRFHGNPPTTIPSKIGSSRVTYSRQRSFLNDVSSTSETESRALAVSSTCGMRKEPYRLSPSRLAPDDDENEGSKPVRGIHELRQAGDNARFQETIDSIFEDIEDIHNSTSGRCSSFAQLCIKLSEPLVVRRFSEQGFDERLLGCMSSSLDIISASLAFCAYKFIILGGSSAHTLCGSLWPKLLNLSHMLLNTEDDILLLAKDPSIGLSKTAQASIRSVRPRLFSVIDSPPLQNLSPCLLALECIKSSLIHFRENGHTIEPIPTLLLGQLVELLVHKVHNKSIASLSPNDFRMLGLLFSILENYSVISGPLNSNQCSCFQRISQLHGIFTPNPDSQSQSILMSYIRVILNLTNKEPSLCSSFATAEIVSGLASIATTEFQEVAMDTPVEENSSLNTVILALGALINLAENTELSKNTLLLSTNDSTSFLQRLLHQLSKSVGFMDQAHSVPEIHQNVVAGYLSILLLALCLDVEVRCQIKTSLDGNGLVMVLSTAEKFLQYHRKIERDSRVLGTWEGGESKLTARLKHIIDQIHRDVPAGRLTPEYHGNPPKSTSI